MNRIDQRVKPAVILGTGAKLGRVLILESTDERSIVISHRDDMAKVNLLVTLLDGLLLSRPHEIVSADKDASAGVDALRRAVGAITGRDLPALQAPSEALTTPPRIGGLQFVDAHRVAHEGQSLKAAS